MAPNQVRSSSGSDNGTAVVDDRKRKRMISNRESARRSRDKKKQLLQALENEKQALELEKAQFKQNIEVAKLKYREEEAHNNILRVQQTELTNRYEYLVSLLNSKNSKPASKKPRPNVVSIPYSMGMGTPAIPNYSKPNVQEAISYSMGIPEIPNYSKPILEKTTGNSMVFPDYSKSILEEDIGYSIDIPEYSKSMGEDIGYFMDIPEIPEHLMNPWQILPLNSMQSDMFLC